MSKIAIEVAEGETIEIDAEVAKGYRTEAFEILKKEVTEKKNFKDAMELQAEGLGIEKPLWQKYIKSAFKTQIKEQQALADSFAALDDALNGEGDQAGE
jgi:hypothetical protein